jgi:hypothetical protein
MSDRSTATGNETASETGGEPGTHLSGLSRATTLAKAALSARLATQQKNEQDKRDRITERLTSVKALLLNTWDTLGINPDTYTLDDRCRPSWSGSLTLTDPDDPNGELNTVTIKTTVALHEDGLYFRAGEGAHTSYNQRSSGTLPDKPPSDTVIGDMILTGWLKELQSRERDRQETFDRLIGTANDIANGYINYNEKTLHGLAVRVAALKPGDLPEPYADNLAKVTAALVRASQSLEAKLEADKAYVAAATRVKLAAAKWVRRYAAWEDECSQLARTLTDHHFRPFVVYEVRYTAIGASVATTDDDGDTTIATEGIYTLQSPLEIAKEGQAVIVNAIDYSANPYVTVIGAFLDGHTALDAKAPPAVTGGARFYHSRRIGHSEYYVRFPPTVAKATIDELMGMLSFPQPPPPFAEEVLTKLNIKITSYHFTAPQSWADVDPNSLSKDVLELEQKPEPEHTEEDKDVEIPF